MELHFDSKFFTSIVLICIVWLFILYNSLVGKQKRLRSKLRKQGINGPPPTFLLGNVREIQRSQQLMMNTSKSPCVEPPSIHDCSSVFPFFQTWKKKYGQVFQFSLGSKQILYVDKPEIVKEIITSTSFGLGKPLYLQKELGPLLGKSILTSNGPMWANQRKIIAPELYMVKVKEMINMIGESAMSLMNSWSDIVEAEGGSADIKVDDYIKVFPADVISKACFGSNYSDGKEIFSKLAALQELMANKSLSGKIPGIRYLPTKNNRKIWALRKEMKDCMLQLVNKRKETTSSSHRNDLLQMLLEAAKNSDLTPEDYEGFIVDNCKTMYFAGYETTATTATWCLMLLASNQEWQDRVRAEVLEICNGRRIPDSDMLPKMKQLTMVIHETMRLYSPIPVIGREALEDIKLGNINVPKGVIIWMILLTSHIDPDIWGPDACKYNPERFVNGIAGASKQPHMYLPFGMGPRVCLGKDLAMTELKIILSLILSNFSFSLSPNYIHSPRFHLVVQPEHGVRLLLKKL